MPRRHCLTPTILALGGLVAAGSVALAQTQAPAQIQAPAQAQAPGQTQQAKPHGQMQGQRDQGNNGPALVPDDQNDSGTRYPVLAISGIEVLRSTQPPVTDIIIVHGVTSTEGWSDAELLPLTRGTPPDGVLDLVLTAEAPQDSSEPTEYAAVQAILPLLPEHPYKAIRVRSANNAVLLKTIPGVVEARIPPAPCNPCIGRHFVAKGATPPSGVAAGEILREEDLPPNTRIVRPTDGVGDVRPNPNRLTLLLGEDGRVTEATWE